MMKILVFTPVYRLEPETVAAVMAMRWDNPISWLFQRDNPVAGDDLAAGMANILHQYRRGREQFLAGGYDAMLVIESDIIPPADTLERLAALDCDVAYGVYRFRRSNAINIFERLPGNPPRNEGESLSLHPVQLKAARDAGVVACSGGGLGCTLIHRHVLEKLDFRLVEAQGGHCDTWFTRDVLRSGYRQVADMRVLCGHKDTDGSVIWPFC